MQSPNQGHRAMPDGEVCRLIGGGRKRNRTGEEGKNKERAKNDRSAAPPLFRRLCFGPFFRLPFSFFFSPPLPLSPPPLALLPLSPLPLFLLHALPSISLPFLPCCSPSTSSAVPLPFGNLQLIYILSQTTFTRLYLSRLAIGAALTPFAHISTP